MQIHPEEIKFKASKINIFFKFVCGETFEIRFNLFAKVFVPKSSLGTPMWDSPKNQTPTLRAFLFVEPPCAYRMFAPCCPGTAYQVYAWWVVRSPVEHRLVGLVCHATNYFTRIISFLICHLNDDDSRVATTPLPASLSPLALHVGKLCNIA